MIYSDNFQNSIAEKMHWFLFLKCQKFIVVCWVFLVVLVGWFWFCVLFCWGFLFGLVWLVFFVFFFFFIWEPGKWKQLLAQSHSLGDAVILPCEYASWPCEHRVIMKFSSHSSPWYFENEKNPKQTKTKPLEISPPPKKTKPKSKKETTNPNQPNNPQKTPSQTQNKTELCIAVEVRSLTETVGVCIEVGDNLGDCLHLLADAARKNRKTPC